MVHTLVGTVIVVLLYRASCSQHQDHYNSTYSSTGVDHSVHTGYLMAHPVVSMYLSWSLCVLDLHVLLQHGLTVYMCPNSVMLSRCDYNTEHLTNEHMST